MQTLAARSEGLMANAIAAIGTDGFGTTLETFVDRICPVDFCTCYRIGADSVDVVSLSDPARYESAARIDSYTHQQLWTSDPALRQIRHQLAASDLAHARLTKQDMPDGRLRDVVYTHLVDRLLVCHKGPTGIFAISALRWRGSSSFRSSEIAALLSSSPVITALIDRHFASSAAHWSPSDAFASVAIAEQCLAAMTSMPPREREVCARLVFGHSVPEIAQELRISSETVKSYVKRAYQRLAITSQRELMLAYLRYWQAWALPSPMGHA
ncbi:MAG: helix-turn-helix transcriptional regulator [Janthinobacterium lividum]